MKFTIDTYDFKKAMEKAYKTIDKGSVLDVLKNIKLHIEGSQSYVLGTNLENFVKVNIDIQATSEVADIIFSDTATLLKAMKFFTDSDITVVVKDDKITLSCGGKTTTQELLKEDGVSGIPDANTENSKHYEYNIASLKERFNLIKYAVGQTDTKPALTGVHFNGSDMVTCDGYRLALNKSSELEVETAFTATVRSLALAVDALDGDIVITANNKFIQMSNGKVIVVSRLLDGAFLDYKSAITKDGKEINVNISDYKDTLKYFKAFKQTGKKAKKQIISWFNDTLLLCGTENSSKIGDSDMRFDAPIGFDNEYMIDALSQFKTDSVQFRIKGNFSPILIESDENNLAVVFPWRLRDTEMDCIKKIA